MKKIYEKKNKITSILSAIPNYSGIGFIVDKNGILRPINNRAKK
jgi:hypothetical protein